MTSAFDQVSSGFYGSYYGLGKTIKPLWTTEFEDDDEFLKWAKQAMDALRDDHRERTERDMRNRDFYMGLQSMSVGKEGIPRDREGRPLDKFARVTINRCFEMIQQWVAKMTRFAPAIAVIPPNQEYNDRISAKLAKEFIDYLFYINDADSALEDVARSVRIDGETYLFVDYDRTKGDYHPDSIAARSLGLRVPLLDQDGNQIQSESNEPLFIEKAHRVGEVDYDLVQRRFVLLQPKTKYKDCEWMIRISSADVDELKAKYPDKADMLDVKTGANSFALDMFHADSEWNEVLQFELIHKSTEFLDSGRYVKFTENAVLENRPRTDSLKEEFPCARLTDVDVPGMLHGHSFLEQIMLLQVMYNNLTSIAYTNMALGAHLYWMVPAQGNVDIKKLRNGASVIKFNGGLAPTLQQYRTVGPELFQSIQFVGDQIQNLSGIHGVSSGQIPPGIEAGVALAFLEEQENQRANTDIKKHNAFIKKLARLSLAVAGDNYSSDDGRTIRIVGKNNAFSIKALDVAKLGGPYDIRVQRTTALSESKSGRLSQILALESRFPGKMPWEQVADMLDLANEEKYYNLATSALRAAERENEAMAEGRSIKAPERWEDHLVHWDTLLRFMQTSNFKEDVPDTIKTLFIDHGIGHEFFMWELAKENPTFAQKLLNFSNFPAFTLAPIPGQASAAPMPPTGGMAPGAPTGGLPPGPEEILPEPTEVGEPPQAGGPEPIPVAPVPPTELPEAPIQ